MTTLEVKKKNGGSHHAKIAVVIPCYRVTKHIISVISSMPPVVDRIYVVDDACPDKSGDLVEREVTDERVRVLRHAENQGVGGAVISGYRAAISDDMDIIVKVDGDGQMEPALIPIFIRPLLFGEADYSKGNRFFELEEVLSMPGIRLFGNAVLSFMTKVSSGYWNVFDPTNGYTAISANVARLLPFDKISKRYFFETDMLFRLNTVRAVVVDIPMSARYADEVSHLKISRIVGEFSIKHCRNFFKRIFYNYYLRDLVPASIELPLGLLLFLFGAIFGVYSYYSGAQLGVANTAGTVMLSALPTILGIQFLLNVLSYDISAVPRVPLSRNLRSFKAFTIDEE
ncbi:MAG: glycosyltransferase family 2 protein [Allorhizobium sp.]